MKLNISGKNLKLDLAMKKHIEQQVYFALSRFSPQVAHVSVTLEDINGPRSQIEKRCRILVKLDRMEEFHVEILDKEARAAVDTAADRMRRSVQRRLERRRMFGRKTPQIANLHDAPDEHHLFED